MYAFLTPGEYKWAAENKKELIDQRDKEDETLLGQCIHDMSIQNHYKFFIKDEQTAGKDMSKIYGLKD